MNENTCLINWCLSQILFSTFTGSVTSCFIVSHSFVSPLWNPPPYLWNSNHTVSTTIPLDFQFKNPLLSQFRKPGPWFRYGYFLESPNIDPQRLLKSTNHYYRLLKDSLRTTTSTRCKCKRVWKYFSFPIQFYKYNSD